MQNARQAFSSKCLEANHARMNQNIPQLSLVHMPVPASAQVLPPHVDGVLKPVR